MAGDFHSSSAQRQRSTIPDCWPTMIEHHHNIPLLATKLFVPSIRPRLVERPQLLGKLDETENSKLVLVTAPAGYGKTTMIASWLAKRNRSVAWVSLDHSENDPLMFLAYVVGALQTVDAGSCRSADALIQSPEPPSIEVILTYLLNDLSCMDHNCLLVLDDYHVIEHEEIHAAVTFLIEKAPGNLQILIASRHQPELPLAKLQARNQVTSLNVLDLRFDHNESAQFVNSVMGLNLDLGQIQELEKRTEGWVAGLQLAALSLQGRSGLSEFDYDLAGDDRLIANFLIGEVLSLQSDRIQQFLLATSLLERFSAELCNALLEIDDARAVLDQLEEANLFLVPLDNKGEWYRYHHLFGEMLRNRLELQSPEMPPVLLKRAVDWHAEQGLTEEAINYAIEGQYFAEAARMIDSIVLRLQDSGKRVLLIKWVEQIPAPFARKYKLWVHYVLAQFYYSRFNESLDYIRQFFGDESLEGPSSADSDSVVTNAYRSLLLSTIDLHTTLNAPRVRQALQTTVAALSEDEFLGFGIALGHYGSASLMLGNVSDAQDALDKAIAVLQRKTYTVRQVFAAYQADAVASAGALRQSSRMHLHTYQTAISKVTHEGDTFSNTLFGLGSLHYEWNDLQKADEMISRSVSIVGKSKSIDRMLHFYQVLLRLRTTQGHFDEVEQCLGYAEQVAMEYDNPPLVMDRINALRARLSLAQGDMLAADRWRMDFERDNPQQLDALQEFEWLTVARIYAAGGHFEQAISLLEHAHDIAMRQGRVRQVVEIGVFLTRTLAETNKTEQALDLLTQTLRLAIVEGYVRSFVDEGPSIQVCLELLRDEQGPPLTANIQEYIRVLLMEFAAEETRKDPGPTTDPLLEEELLTPREHEALRLLAEGHTYSEIAAQLVISENTLKFHLKNVYSKLDVRNRTQAVLKAQEINLI